jgi:glutamate racemase
VPGNIKILEQGEIIAEKLADYLQRHTELDAKISKNSHIEYQTTEVAQNFEEKASLFMGKPVKAKTIHL